MVHLNYTSPLKGEITIPGDKSMTHRAIMLASLAKGHSTINQPLLGEDCLRTASIFKKLGVSIDIQDDQIIIDSPGYHEFKTPHQTLYTGNSGTTTRLMAGLLGGLGIQSVLSGDVSIGRRPMNRILKPLKQMNINISAVENNYTPLVIQPSQVQGIDYTMPVASAQVKSAILFAGLFANSKTSVQEIDVSRNHTETMFSHYNIPIKKQGLNITLPKNSIQHIQPRDFVVPGDISSAAFFIVAALIIPGSDITLHHVGINPTRDGIIEIVQKMGGHISLFNQTDGAEPTASIRVRYTPHLKGIKIGGQLIPRCIDELPVIALLCTQANSSSIIVDAEELKVKETNRIDTTAIELSKLGLSVKPTEDGLTIEPSKVSKQNVLDSQTDHRIGMTLAVAALLSNKPITIQQFDCVNVSFPGFLPMLKQLEKEG
ncbi:3-phosphoshikimate 1-carboxyvinyltransferase [Staphylococcus felis]|uniref:3-phosphoshikimate 1-carboxyvinyltransferase n=1 Tax=Staphylococcus felis TaxID=46127 RepID=A0A2K3ZCQ4_9STAP|nr:3-phosphoshikimate 1-carboxyvinyltransferase [Staphylococcus felis]AVP37075.1 3-phosphoshikimate 1-carboxyvinyltransferase [Staphylococcus felis]PNZ35636.1 3-phosphoshikimate 1-carboxyvinyltransferase [Staphylococcus felis]QQB02973.1 3-phosphoshikimate 1-carboxyvinyltransferase [Staphylococcus felis]REH79025.1 3-phosphoshikimate 1-carboxyvinyltransferase [Staphylococcus felis]REH94830.1 3-phosphoshikimate 1-carboxyvinyltransferase [Staphylococcus felis]